MGSRQDTAGHLWDFDCMRSHAAAPVHFGATLEAACSWVVAGDRVAGQEGSGMRQDLDQGHGAAYASLTCIRSINTYTGLIGLYY